MRSPRASMAGQNKGPLGQQGTFKPDARPDRRQAREDVAAAFVWLPEVKDRGTWAGVANSYRILPRSAISFQRPLVLPVPCQTQDMGSDLGFC